MAQKTDLNVGPYFDDFSQKDQGARDKNYYKVLFKPERPIQAREINTLQSILQDQIESFGSHIFKEGSVVIPGNITFDSQFFAVKLKPTQYNVYVTSYLSEFVGKKITGQVSGVTAVVQHYELPSSEIEYPTLYVKYIDSDVNYEINPFQNNEELYATEDVVYSSTTITSGTPFSTTIDSNATSIGSAASIGEGVYFIRGTFVRVPKQTIVLDYYTNTPSYRIGLRVDEQIITAKDDKTLYDNARGFSNYAAPGADRFKIALVLTKKLLTDTNDTDFVELLKVKDGAIKKIETKSSYSILKDYIAQRTYDESGDYVVEPFQFSLNNSLNDRLGNDGLFFSDEKTEQSNTPSDDLMCIKFSPGKAYVRGYDIEKTGVEIIDVEKPRTTQSITNSNTPFEMGNLLRVNNVSGIPKQREVIYLQSRRKNSTSVSAGSTIGSARVYNFNVTDSAYTGASTNWDLYLFDVQTYTILTLNQSVTSAQVPTSSFIKGKNTGASGYVVSAGSDNQLTLRQTSGSFAVGEPVLINGSDLYSRTVTAVNAYTIDDIKSVYQPQPSGFTTSFVSDTLLDRNLKTGTLTITAGSGGISTATVSLPETLIGIKTDNIIRYQRAGLSTESYNRVVSINSNLTSMTLEAVSNVSNICDGTLPTSQYTGPYSVGIAKLKNEEKGFLYAQLPNTNISAVNLDSSTITFSAQSNVNLTPTSNTLTVDAGSFNLGINSTTARFNAFDEERYSIAYTNGTIENLTSDKVSINPGATQITFSNIPNTQISAINATFIKSGIQSKVKQYNRSKIINVTFSKNSQSGIGINTSINDGLTYNQFYGLRVQDEEISLNYPDVAKVLAIYESLNTSSPEFDKITFSSIANVDTNAIVGENIVGKTSNAIARIIGKPSTNTLSIVYLNTERFNNGENVLFDESNILTTISTIVPGTYKNITNKFTLDKGQKEQYYDYSKIIRNSGESAPSRQLLIVFDYYSVPSSDTGDVFTVGSYDESRFSSDIPDIGKNNVRSSDVLDFRPRVPVFTGSSSSPFDFISRSFTSEPKLIISPNESSIIGYDYYLGRIDKLYLDRYGKFTVLQGSPSINPKPPTKPDDVMELATITLPPYLHNPKDAQVSVVDNRRYTMRDIGKIEDRVENLERVTSLSLLELNTQTLQIRDAQGINRFKTGFFVDDFKNTDLINTPLSSVQIDNVKNELHNQISTNSITLKPVSAADITDENLDLSANFELLDKNTQKTGDVITLKYDSVNWIEQSFATKVENVNPFHVISYSGIIKLNPSSDSWVRTLRLDNVSINQTNWVWLRTTGTYSIVGSETSTTTEDRLISSGSELYMRSRNTGFMGANLKPLTRVYQFLDGNSGVDFIPKLIEIAIDSTLQTYGASTSFQIGETVKGTYNGASISFRVAAPNHKSGPYSSPTETYSINPYVPSESIPTSYSASSKVLNVDIDALCTEAQGLYSGYVLPGMKLVGQTSGATAYVKDLRLITDNNGFVSGTFFLREPNTTPPPSVRIATGSKVYKLTSSSSNESPLSGSTLISSAETIYKAEGTWEQRQRINTTSTSIYYEDPLAQSFTVGGTTETSNGNKPNEDVNGAYLTAVDLFFANKDPNNAPLTVEIRTVELGTPTRTIVGRPVTLKPSDINTSSNASVATKVTFDYPIYLSPGLEYALVLLAPQTDKYEVWIAEMGQKTIETANLPDSQSVRYSRQFAIGSLFKSQNGSIWTANQYQDLKFKLYKANFTSKIGSVFFNNPTLNESNGYVPKLPSNPVTILPRKYNLGITTIYDSGLIGILTTGRKVASQAGSYSGSYGYIVGTGSSVSTVGLTTGGSNYSTGAVQTYNITGNGSGLRLNINSVSNGVITGIGVSSLYTGNGYAVGDIVGIVTSSVSPPSGKDARVTITAITGCDTLYLSNVQGDSFNSVGVSTLVYYNDSGTPISLASTSVTSRSTEVGGFYSGNYMKVNHYNHGMYSGSNKINLSGLESDVPPTTLTAPLSSTDTTISIASTSNFGTFENLSVVNSNTAGYIKIDDEIIKYESVVSGQLQTITRGIDSTIPTSHDLNSIVYKYELGGVSLRRINSNYTISGVGIDIDGYYLQFDRTSNGYDRSVDNNPSGTPQLSFNSEQISGGSNIRATENIQYNSIEPHLAMLTPGASTSAVGQIRTISGTSVSGSEISFADLGYETIELTNENQLNSTRIICSNINEQTYLTALPRKKSFTLKVDLNTEDTNLSPMIFWKDSSITLKSNRLNAPISDYATDGRVNSILNDPHAAIYVSNTVRLAQPATALKVIISAYRHTSADFRVLYSLIRPDSSEIDQVFELFPGYNNLTIDSNQDGYYDIIDTSKNDGLPDTFVPPSLNNQFLEYEFSANNLGSFTGYTIKIVMSGTNQAHAPRFKDLRSIALA
jgi:hypothetical protein